MYAVVKTGGKQHRVREGDLVRVEKLEGDVGTEIDLDQVLLIGGEGETQIGQPTVQGAKIQCEIVRQGKAKKVLVFKMKRRKNYHRTYGHRQPFTHLRIKKIAVG